MRKSEIEAWVLQIVDQIETKSPSEDDRVELKADWIDPSKAARRIGAHANSAMGEPVLWIIGADEERGVVGASKRELSDWWDQVKSCFDEDVFPALTSLNVPVSSQTVVALYFETDRAPYVVKSRKGGIPSRGVPWREGNSTRTARRSDLLRILAPTSQIPSVEVVEGFADYRQRIKDDEPTENYILFDIDLYFVPRSRAPITIPFHRCNFSIEFEDVKVEPDPSMFGLSPLYNRKNMENKRFGFEHEPDSITVESTQTETIITGPGMAKMEAELPLSGPIMDDVTSFQFVASLSIVNTERSLPVEVQFSRVKRSPGQPLKARYEAG